MLILSDWFGKEIQVTDYSWDAGLEDFKCELRNVDIEAVTEAVKGGGSWLSTSPAGSHPYNVDITIKEKNLILDGTIKFKCFVWESWDAEGNNVKITGMYYGEPATWKGYEDLPNPHPGGKHEV